MPDAPAVVRCVEQNEQAQTREFTEAQNAAVEQVVRRALRCGLPPNVRADDIRQTARLAILQASHDDPFRIGSIAARTLIRIERRYAARHQEITPSVADSAIAEEHQSFDVTPFLSGLGFEESLAVKLRYLHGHTWSHIGEALGMEPDAARMLATRTLERLKFA